jgi:hypothetical protein
MPENAEVGKTVKKSKKFTLVAVGVFFLAIIYVAIKYPEFRKKAQESEVKLTFEAYATAQKSYHEEWKRYSSDPKDVGFSTAGSRLRLQLLHTADQLSAEDKQVLGQEMPYASESSYKVIGKFNGESYISYWSFDQDHNLVKLLEIQKK